MNAVRCPRVQLPPHLGLPSLAQSRVVRRDDPYDAPELRGALGTAAAAAAA